MSRNWYTKVTFIGIKSNIEELKFEMTICTKQNKPENLKKKKELCDGVSKE